MEKRKKIWEGDGRESRSKGGKGGEKEKMKKKRGKKEEC